MARSRRPLGVGVVAVWMVALAARQQVFGQGGPGGPGGPDAPVGIDGRSNGLLSPSDFATARAAFGERYSPEQGIGPVFNGVSCGECHRDPVVGGGSQVTVVRAGHFDGATFFEHPGGSLIQRRATIPSLLERVLPGNEVRAIRISSSVLGDGFVEAIDDRTIQDIARSQPSSMRGEVAIVPVLEAPGATRVGRFGWKAQHASLLSFSADALLNEMGLTNRLLLTENTSNGRSVASADPVPDTAPNGEDVRGAVDTVTAFMRSTRAPSRDEDAARTPEALQGASLFATIGCATCHVADITTAPAGRVINGGAFTVPAALGSKTIHPYSDFLLHDVGTGDGIVQNAGASSRNKIRTAPLWGLRTRSQLMHDGLSLTVFDAITRHGGEARDVIRAFSNLRDDQKLALLAFLDAQ